ncbi:MAG: ABC transporter permease [Bacillota bacterium]|nr:ABC transporter permease [Bacillota bacterium]
MKTIPKASRNNSFHYEVFTSVLNSHFGVSVLAIILSVVLLAALAALYGASPIEVILVLCEGALSGKRAIVYTLLQMAPIVLCALAVYIPARARFFNVGGQGQLEIAGLAAMIVGTNVTGHPALVIILAMLAAVVAGMLTIAIPLVLKMKRGASEITTTIMMNFVCTYFVYALITGPLKDPGAFYAASKGVPKEYLLPNFPVNSQLNIGVYFVFVIAIIVALFMKYTVSGMKLKAAGMNMDAAKAAGISVNRLIVLATLAGAACAGFAGGMEVLGVTERIAEGWALAWGTTGIAVAHLGGSPLGILPLAFILAVVETGARYMQAMTGVPSALVNVMQGLPVVIYVCLLSLGHLLKMKKIDMKVGE